jgi:hypothetical protein
LVNAGGFGNAGAIFAGGTITSANASHNSITAASATDLTLATLDSNRNILLTPHGSGFVIARSLLSSQRDLVPTSSLVGQVAAVGFTNTNKATVMGYDTTNNFGFIYAGIVGSNYSPLVLQPMAASGNVLIGGTTDISGSGGLKVFGTTASTSTTTGSLVNAGGFGNAGAAYFGSTITASGVIASSTGLTATSGNALQVNNSLNDAAATIFNSGTTGASVINFRTASTTRLTIADTVATFTTSVRSTSATGGIGYATGAGGAVTQGTSRTTGVTLNNVCGAITLFTAAGSATWQSFTVTNSAVAATDTIIVNQRSGTDLYMISVTAVGAGSFRISYATTGGTTSEAPIFNFSVIKAVSS